GMPVISLMILPRPSRISCSVAAMSLVLLHFLGFCTVGPCKLCGSYGRSGNLDDLARVREAGAEAEDEGEPARADLATLQHARERERDGRGRGVAGVHD